MSNYLVANAVVKMDRGCDFIPGLSTITSAVNIIVKIVLGILAQIRPSIVENPYVRHLISKSYLVCFALMIPGVNFIVSCVIASRQSTKPAELQPTRFTALPRPTEPCQESEQVEQIFFEWTTSIQGYKPPHGVTGLLEDVKRIELKINTFRNAYQQALQKKDCPSPMVCFKALEKIYNIGPKLVKIARRSQAL